ncbi:MAG: ABC transporter ATP-binding protein [Actinomycetota bacterium]
MAEQRPPIAIEIDSLSKTYEGGRGPEVKAVQTISISVDAGEVFGFLGPNGAGKTTTIKMMAGLLTPTAGTVRLNGYDISKARSAAVLQIGAVLEGGRNVYWTLSAWQNLIYFGRLKGLRAKEIKPRAEKLLQDLDLWERRAEPVGGFSRGMQQKVAIAAALITDPPILLLDEPTIGLDVEAARMVKGWISSLARDHGKTVLLTTHQLHVAEELCTRVAIIRDGIIAADLALSAFLAQFREDRYRISVDASIESERLRLPSGSSIAHEDGSTVLVLTAQDHRPLYELLDQLRTLDAPVASVTRVAPDFEDVFLRLASTGTK